MRLFGAHFYWSFPLVFGLVLVGCGGEPEGLEAHGFDTETLVVETQAGESIEFDVALALSDESHYRGLQEVADLLPEEGMWFVYESPEVLSYWMYKVLIPLDIIFVNSDGQVVTVHSNVPPCESIDPTDCMSYASFDAAQYVLELNGGMADQYGIAPGDRVIWNE